MREVASGVFMVTHAHTNCYLVVDAGAVTIVDAGYPSTWEVVRNTLDAIGLRVTDVAAVLLTHGHFDHVGFARIVQSRFAVPVWVHEADRWLAAHPYRYRPQRNRLLFPLRHPRSIPVLSRMVSAGGSPCARGRRHDDLRGGPAGPAWFSSRDTDPWSHRRALRLSPT